MARRTLDVEIVGWPSLNRAMQAAPKAARKGLERLVRASADAIEDRAFQLVHIRDGDLARAIGQSGTGINRKVGVSKAAVGSRGGSSSHQYPSVYGHFEEYGANGREPHPFMRPAADEEETRFSNARVRELAAELEREVARAGKGT